MSEAISATWLSETIGAIYDCAIDPGRWLVALGRIRAGLNCANVMLSLRARCC
jgi:hypothetical protein